MIKKMSPDQIVRVTSIEKKFGIEELRINAYISESELTVVGEIISDKITDDFSLTCTVYDQDGDMIESLDNISYGDGLVTRAIKQKVFFSGYPFRFSEYIDKGVKVSKIRVVPC